MFSSFQWMSLHRHHKALAIADSERKSHPYATRKLDPLIGLLPSHPNSLGLDLFFPGKSSVESI